MIRAGLPTGPVGVHAPSRALRDKMHAMRLRKPIESHVRHARRARFTDCKAIAEDTIRGLDKRTRYNTAYLLGLLAMIKCSICSYQCDN
jgi:hypothetical protein